MAIVGAGNIAGKMAATIREMETVESYAVASRDLERARQFAKKYGFKKVSIREKYYDGINGLLMEKTL